MDGVQPGVDTRAFVPVRKDGDLDAARKAASARSTLSASSEANALIAALHTGYYEALHSARGQAGGAWEAAVAVSDPGHQEAASSESGSAGEEIDTESISAFLGEAQRVEEAFGPLNDTLAPGDVDMSIPPTPEILRLFAPAEHNGDHGDHGGDAHHASHAHAPPRRFTAPPALARREHHALALDSWLPDLHAVTERNAACTVSDSGARTPDLSCEQPA
ncbi:TagK domain-containing protein [Caballeronia sp. LZ035]|uniref:TagK domain-containing protein n=1 Tax=Caballeronia sp. LZ035 TaxID=3038568 RepID=UPI002854CB99|nr:TagK domain-containing protein [Caballeronia sp. LZ035]MDR5760426.1 TagK domain-containing protein [Caballeronia sp. LZ035]